MTSCKRKRTRASDSYDAGRSFSTTAELYSDCSRISSPQKKCKAKDRSRLHQNDDDFSRTYTDEDRVFVGRNFSECPNNSNVIQRADCAETALLSDQPHAASNTKEQQSSNFEDLLFGVISENECSQVISQKCDTAAVVEKTNKRTHASDSCNSISDVSSEFSDEDTSHSAGQVGVNNRYSVNDNNTDLGGTSHLLPAAVLNSSNNPCAAADSEFNIVNSHSVDKITDLLQKTKKENKVKKHEKWSLDCSKLCNEAECRERKREQKRLCTRASDSDDAGRSFCATAELYSDYSGITSSQKKRRLHKNNDDFSHRTYRDDDQVFVGHNFAECQTDSNAIQRADYVQITPLSDQPHDELTTKQQQSSNFEDLLFGVISENECSQAISQKCDTAAVVEKTSKRTHTPDSGNSTSDVSSEFSDEDTSQSAGRVGVNNRYSVVGKNIDRGGTSRSLPAAVLNSCNNSSAAAHNEFNIVNSHSVDEKTDLSQTKKKQNKVKKHEKWTLDCSKLCNEAECHERKQEQKRHHMLASIYGSQTFSKNKNQYALLRKVHRSMNMHGTVCTQPTADVDNRCSKLNCRSSELKDNKMGSVKCDTQSKSQDCPDRSPSVFNNTLLRIQNYR